MHLTPLPKAFYHSSNFGPSFSSVKTNQLISVLPRTVGQLHYQIFYQPLTPSLFSFLQVSPWHFCHPNYFIFNLIFPFPIYNSCCYLSFGFCQLFFFFFTCTACGEHISRMAHSSNSFNWVLTFPYSPKPCIYIFTDLLTQFHLLFRFCLLAIVLIYFVSHTLFLFFWLQKSINLSSFISNLSFIFHEDISEATLILWTSRSFYCSDGEYLWTHRD